MYKEWWGGAQCGTSVNLNTGKTATQIYNGTARPDFWIMSLAFTNLTAAKQANVAVLQDAAANLGAGDLKTRITGLSHTDNEATLLEHCAWLVGRRKAGTTANILETAFYRTIRFLQDPVPLSASGPVGATIRYLMEELAQDLATSRTDVYTVLRAEIDETTFKTIAATSEVLT